MRAGETFFPPRFSLSCRNSSSARSETACRRANSSNSSTLRKRPDLMERWTSSLSSRARGASVRPPEFSPSSRHGAPGAVSGGGRGALRISETLPQQHGAVRDSDARPLSGGAGSPLGGELAFEVGNSLGQGACILELGERDAAWTPPLHAPSFGNPSIRTHSKWRGGRVPAARFTVDPGRAEHFNILRCEEHVVTPACPSPCVQLSVSWSLPGMECAEGGVPARGGPLR